MKFGRKPDILAIAGDGLAYGVTCMQILDSSIEVWDFVDGMFYRIPKFLAMWSSANHDNVFCRLKKK